MSTSFVGRVGLIALHASHCVFAVAGTPTTYVIQYGDGRPEFRTTNASEAESIWYALKNEGVKR